MVRFSFLAIVFFLYVASSYARNNIVDVQAICKQAQDPSFCFTFLKSRPGGPGKDLGDLESYTLGVLHTNVSNTITLITKLIAQSGSDLKKQNHYKTCLDQFGDEEGALGFVKRAQQDLENSDYISLNLNASVVKNIAEIIVNISSTRPFFLLHFLKSRPGGPGKDLGDLESYTLGVLRDEGALGFVKRAQQDLENSDYISVNLNAAAVSDFADDCLSDDNIPIKDTSLLPKNASVIKNIAENIAIISNMLM
ncbi:pectinesterase inhibitor [Trifolium repens]|nr:pectinesterase inhibitor [Trifolium repens]